MLENAKAPLRQECFCIFKASLGKNLVAQDLGRGPEAVQLISEARREAGV